MNVYNTAFFRNIENSFIILEKWEGKEYALRFVTALMEKSLGAAYSSMGAKLLSGSIEFQRCVKERDSSVGLKIEFQELENNSFSYKFYTDPFPGLKGEVDPYELDATYMKFKVNYFLGNDWKYETPKHLWLGDKYTEHLIKKK